MKGIDYTASTTITQAKALKVAGYNFVCRYLVPVSMAWKRLTKAEAEILTEVGLQIVSVFESTADRAKSGSNGGTADGKSALSEAKLVGQPTGSTIYFAVDYDAQASDYNAIESYLKSAQAQILGYNVGIYGSYAVCEEMFKRGIKYCWQTYAWSRGKKSDHANVYQYKNGIVDCGISGDANESFGNEGFWNLSKPLTWDEITNKVSDSPSDWHSAINTAINAAKANGDLGALETFKYLPDLIMKIYNYGRNVK